MVERHRRQIKIIRTAGEDVSVEGIDPEEFIEEKELADGTWVMKIRVPGHGSKGREASGPLAPAAGVSGAIGDLQAKLSELVRQARADGYTWTQIGAALGISKQAAWERFSGED